MRRSQLASCHVKRSPTLRISTKIQVRVGSADLQFFFFNPVSISDASLFTVKTMSDDGYGGGGDDFDYESGAAGYATSLSTFH